MASDERDITQLLLAWSEGDDDALGKLAPLIEAELQRLARHYLRGERPGHTLQPTALVNEAYIRLFDWRKVSWQNRAHFMGIAANMMRRILVDRARRHGFQKRGGDAVKVSLDASQLRSFERDLDPSQTRIRDIESGKEKPFTRALFHPRWSSDGMFVAGRDSFRNITICPTDGGMCRPLTMGWAPKWLHGHSRIYFDRQGTTTLLEVWSISRNGGDERKLADLTDFSGFIDYSSTGQILWVRTRSSSSELWSSTLPGY